MNSDLGGRNRYRGSFKRVGGGVGLEEWRVEEAYCDMGKVLAEYRS